MPMEGRGTKVDLRQNYEAGSHRTFQSFLPVKREQGITTASEIKAVAYMECSALTQEGLNE
ncbi:hypothetical protein KUTeg_012333, partial [Tegillarca granosa]